MNPQKKTVSLMRARVLSEDVVDVGKTVDKNRNDYFVDGTIKKKKSVPSSTSSYFYSSMMTKNPWVLLVLGIAFGAFLPTLVRHESVRAVHKHVNGAYKAHREASKEYMKRYRETYLGEMEKNYVSENENELLLENMVKEEEKKVEEALVEEEVRTAAPIDDVAVERANDVEEARRSNSSPDAPQSLPVVHILNLVTGTGLGQIVEALVPILETLKNTGYERFAVHECGEDPPWKRGWNKLVSCEDRPEKNNIYHNFKRTYESGGKQTMIEVMKEFEKYENSNEIDHLNGNMNDWNEILSSKEIYGNAAKMLMVQQMHNKYAKTSASSICTSMRYWFDEPVGDLLELVREPEREMHKVITFHIRTFADENIGIAFNDDLSLNEELAEQRRDKGKAPEPRTDRIKKIASEFPKMIQKMVEVCNVLFERTGKKTHVAVDSQAVRDYLRKHDAVIQVISTDIEKYKEHYYTEPAYTLNDVADWYLLSLGQTVVAFPTESSYSASAHCRGGSAMHNPCTERQFTETVYKVLESEFKEDIFTSKTLSATSQSKLDVEGESNVDWNEVVAANLGIHDSGDGNTNIKLADIPFPSPEDAEFRFHETSSGFRTCLPGVPAEYSDVLTADSVTGSTISPDECLWLNDVKRAGIAASKLPSDCVPDKTVYSSHANEYHWEMLIFNLQNLKDRKCFMNRLVIECMDDKALELCKASGYIKHCVPYPKALRGSDFERPEGQTESKSDYNALTWIKEKVAFSLMHADLSVFMFDSDVLFFDVPDLVEIQASKPDVIIFFQLASIEDEEVEKAGEFTKEYHFHQTINTGQLLWKPSSDMKRVLLKAFRAGNVKGRIDALDQGYFGRTLRIEDDGAVWEKAHHLSSKFDSGCFHHRPYDEEKKLKRTTFHACCYTTLSSKLQVLKMEQEYFLQHEKEREQMLSAQ